jgi:pimeloyl-ACP methyl ester carboxylesterase
MQVKGSIPFIAEWLSRYHAFQHTPTEWIRARQRPSDVSMKTAHPEAMPVELREAYRKVAPQPENLGSFFYKARNRMRDFKDVPDEVIHSINAPTLVVGSDRDVMRPEGAIELFRLLPHAQLAVLPGTEHMAIPPRTALLVPMIERFLDSEESGPGTNKKHQ